MSEQGVKPEVLPGDLITRPGLYESRGGDIVPITGWEKGLWVSQSNGIRTYYKSDGCQRFYEERDPHRWQLLHWVGPLPTSEPETTTEQLAEIEAQADTVQVREGRWRKRSGAEVSVSAMPTDHDDFAAAYPWWDGDVTTWANNGRYAVFENAMDLLEYLGPIEPEPEPQPQPQPQPIHVREGRWRTRGGEVRNITPTPEGDGRAERWPWWDGQHRQVWTSEGRYYLDTESPFDLVEHLGPIEPEIGWQAEAIGRLQGEAHVLNMEIGGLERQLMQRDARIRDLEMLHAAAAQAVVDAGEANDALRLQVQNRQNKCEQQKGRIDFLETLNAGNDAGISDYRTQVEKLQGLVNTARGQLEAAATERDELRAAIDAADKQLDQRDAQIRDLRIELDAAQQVPQPVSDEERERIWDDATEQAGRQVIRWLRPLTLALSRQPNERFSQFMVLTLSILPDVVPELLGYAVEDGADSDCDE